MKYLVFVCLFCAWFTPLMGQGLSAGGQGNDKGFAVATTADGGVVVVGSFGDTATFGLGQSVVISQGNQDLFIARYDADGNFDWVRTAGGGLNDLARSVTIANNGDIYVAGEFQGTVDFGGESLSSGGDFDFFLARYTSGGQLIWVRGGGGDARMSAAAVALGQNDQVFVGGYFNGDAVVNADTLSSIGLEDIFLARYQTDGTLDWVNTGGGLFEDEITDLVVDAAGEVFAVGFFHAALIYPGISVAATGSTNPDAFLMRVENGGNAFWGRKLGGSRAETAVAVGLGANQEAVVVGNFSGTIVSDTVTLVSRGSSDIFLWSLDTNNQFVGLQQMGGSGEDVVLAGDAAPSGEFYFAGTFEDEATFGFTTVEIEDGGQVFMAKRDEFGLIDWVKLSSGIIFGQSMGISAVDDDRAYLTGGFRETALIAQTELTAAGDWDVFVAGFEQSTSLPTPQPLHSDSPWYYPNPNQGLLQLNPNNLPQPTGPLNIYNTMGKLVHQATVAPSQQSLTLTNLPAGLYLLSIPTTSGTWTGRLVLE